MARRFDLTFLHETVSFQTCKVSREKMILRKKVDSVDSQFSGEPVQDVYLCAERVEDGKIQLFEQYERSDKEGPHSITRKVIADEEFVEDLYRQISKTT